MKYVSITIGYEIHKLTLLFIYVVSSCKRGFPHRVLLNKNCASLVFGVTLFTTMDKLVTIKSQRMAKLRWIKFDFNELCDFYIRLSMILVKT